MGIRLISGIIAAAAIAGALFVILNSNSQTKIDNSTESLEREDNTTAQLPNSSDRAIEPEIQNDESSFLQICGERDKVVKGGDFTCVSFKLDDTVAAMLSDVAFGNDLDYDTLVRANKLSDHDLTKVLKAGVRYKVKVR